MPKDKENHPAVGFIWSSVQSFLRKLNETSKSNLPEGWAFRLPSEAEWEKAARGTNGQIYPWGDTFDKTRCNTKEGGKEDTTPVDAYSSRGDSPYGVADMVGNVFEWTLSLNKPYPYDPKDGREDPYTFVGRLARGCYYGMGGMDGFFARCACRGLILNDYNCLYDVGLRLVLAPHFL
jgi:formylglycine-generating enzyme required for sulfatase activity